jgi:hypothetical protein
MDIQSKMFVMDDDFGNRLYMRMFIDVHGISKKANVYLKLKSEEKHRQLGILDLDKKIFYCKRNTNKHLHIKTDSFGFNWQLLQDPVLSINYIHLTIDNEQCYLISKKVVSDFGDFLNFKQQGFELQKFVSNKMLKKHNIIENLQDILNTQTN